MPLSFFYNFWLPRYLKLRGLDPKHGQWTADNPITRELLLQPEGNETLQKLLDLAELAERKMRFVGLVAFEDVVNEGVPETIEKLQHSGIKFWLTSSATMATTIGAGYSTGLLRPHMHEIKLFGLESNRGRRSLLFYNPRRHALTPKQMADPDIDPLAKNTGSGTSRAVKLAKAKMKAANNNNTRFEQGQTSMCRQESVIYDNDDDGIDADVDPRKLIRCKYGDADDYVSPQELATVMDQRCRRLRIELDDFRVRYLERHHEASTSVLIDATALDLILNDAIMSETFFELCVASDAVVIGSMSSALKARLIRFVKTRGRHIDFDKAEGKMDSAWEQIENAKNKLELWR